MACPGAPGEVGFAIALSLDEAGEERAERTGDRVAAFGQHSWFGAFKPGQQEVVLGGVEQREGAVLESTKQAKLFTTISVDSALPSVRMRWTEPQRNCSQWAGESP
jgi:hypothetical protein